MARRRARVGRKPRQGPGHNEANKQTKASRSKAKMLDAGKEAHFRYDVEEILVKAGLEPETWRPFLQTLWAQGTRNGIPEAKEWLKSQVDEGIIDDATRQKIATLVDKTVRYR